MWNRFKFRLKCLWHGVCSKHIKEVVDTRTAYIASWPCLYCVDKRSSEIGKKTYEFIKRLKKDD